MIILGTIRSLPGRAKENMPHNYAAEERLFCQNVTDARAIAELETLEEIERIIQAL